MSYTRIEWADRTWEPVSGCTKVSTGCKNCYAERLANGRLRRFYPDGFDTIRLYPERLELPLRWRKPSRIFVCSRSDLFHGALPDEFIAQVWGTMIATHQCSEHGRGLHTFLVLTKRPERMRALLSDEGFWRKARYAAPLVFGQIPSNAGPRWPLLQVWLGVSVENQETADERIPLLLDTPAAVRFVSAEPLLGPVDLRRVRGNLGGSVDLLIDAMGGRYAAAWSGRETNISANPRPCAHIDWLIVGAESGPGARPMDEDWVRPIRDQCDGAGIPFFYKQQCVKGKKISLPKLDGQIWAEFPKVMP